MANRSEPLLNAVNHSKPKMLTGLNQTVRGRVQGLTFPLPQTDVPPAERRGLSHPGTNAERGKPVALPAAGTANREERQ